VLADHQPPRRQIEHLTDILADQLPVSEIPAATITTPRPMAQDRVRTLHPLQMTTPMTGLAARLATRRRCKLRVAGGFAYPSEDGGFDELREF
jgi:hypothetical protein